MIGLSLDGTRELGIDCDPGTVHGQYPTASGTPVQHPDAGPGAHPHLGQPTSYRGVRPYAGDDDRSAHLVESRAHPSRVAPP